MTTPDLLTRLRELAAKATPGPWVKWPKDGGWRIRTADGKHKICRVDLAGHASEQTFANQRFIAACSPGRIAALVDCAEALKYVLPLAKGYAHLFQVGGNADKIAGADAALARLEEGK